MSRRGDSRRAFARFGDPLRPFSNPFSLFYLESKNANKSRPQTMCRASPRGCGKSTPEHVSDHSIPCSGRPALHRVRNSGVRNRGVRTFVCTLAPRALRRPKVVCRGRCATAKKAHGRAQLADGYDLCSSGVVQDRDSPNRQTLEARSMAKNGQKQVGFSTARQRNGPGLIVLVIVDARRKNGKGSAKGPGVVHKCSTSRPGYSRITHHCLTSLGPVSRCV